MVSAGRPSIDDRLPSVALVLFLLVVVTNPALVGALFLWLVIILGLLWLLGRIGLLGGMGFLVGVLGMSGGRNQRWQPPTLSFRCQFPTGTREVRVRGFDAGVQLGDRVEVSGVAVRGVVEATRVVNLSTGAVLRRHGLTRLVVMSVLCLWLLVCLISQVTG